MAKIIEFDPEDRPEKPSLGDCRNSQGALRPLILARPLRQGFDEGGNDGDETEV